MKNSSTDSLNGRALTWWRSLSRSEQMQVFSQTVRAEQNWTFQMFAASTREIVKAYTDWFKENNNGV